MLGRLFLTFSGESSSSSDGYAKCRGDGQVDVFACRAEGEAFCQEAGRCAFQWECQAAEEEGNRSFDIFLTKSVTQVLFFKFDYVTCRITRSTRARQWWSW